MKITYSVYTDIGGRVVNEDSLRVTEIGESKLFLLADGLGGHGKGDLASGLVTRVMAEMFSEKSSMKNFLEESVLNAQKELLKEQERQWAKDAMKTTVVALMLQKKEAKWIHCGDSRLYLFYKDKVAQKTLDHSLLQKLLFAGEITEEDAQKNGDRNVLLQVMGTRWEAPQYSASKIWKLRKCQAFLLCSDGFWELISESQMEYLLKESSTVEEWLEKMKTVVRQNGQGINMDNNTAIAVWCEK